MEELHAEAQSLPLRMPFLSRTRHWSPPHTHPSQTSSSGQLGQGRRTKALEGPIMLEWRPNCVCFLVMESFKNVDEICSFKMIS